MCQLTVEATAISAEYSYASNGAPFTIVERACFYMRAAAVSVTALAIVMPLLLILSILARLAFARRGKI